MFGEALLLTLLVCVEGIGGIGMKKQFLLGAAVGAMGPILNSLALDQSCS